MSHVIELDSVVVEPEAFEVVGELSDAGVMAVVDFLMGLSDGCEAKVETRVDADGSVVSDVSDSACGVRVGPGSD